jgi:hypothetical protein
MVFNANFNNISVISWRSVLLVEETGGPKENHRTVSASHEQTQTEDRKCKLHIILDIKRAINHKNDLMKNSKSKEQ